VRPGSHTPVVAAHEEESVSGESVPEVSAEDGHRLVEEGALLLDVREADEWDAGHAPGALWMPVGEVAARVHELARDRRIVAICRSGARSRAVAEALLGAGYDAVNLDGGMRAWASEDLPVVASDGLPGTVI
jgi:rhodanese-related sulfurtransferase